VLLGGRGHKTPVAVPLATRLSGGGVELDVDVTGGDSRDVTSGRGLSLAFFDSVANLETSLVGSGAVGGRD